MKSQTPKRIKSTSQATLHTNPGGDNRWRPEVRFFAKTAKRIKSTSPGKTKKPKNESSLQARAPPPKPKRAPGSIRERSERVRYSTDVRGTTGGQSYDCSQICVTEVIVINVTLTAVKPFFGRWLWLDYVPHSSSHDYDYDLTTSALQEVNTLTTIAVMTFLPNWPLWGDFFHLDPLPTRNPGKFCIFPHEIVSHDLSHD